MDIPSILALVLFGLVQVFALIALIVLRYHFRLFAFPEDRRARRIVIWFTLVTVLFFFGSLGLISPFLTL
jgi:hypothetical protein